MSSGGGGFLLTWYTFVTPSIIINVKYNAKLIKVTNDTCYQKRYVYYVLLLSNSLCTFTLRMILSVPNVSYVKKI